MWVIILKFVEKLLYIENKAVKNFLYDMRGGKIFLISNNLENRSHMISCNPVKALGNDIIHFIYI